MLVLGLDYETTGLDFETDRVIEIGATVWDMKARKAVHFHSGFVLGNEWPIPDPQAKAVTGIEDDWVRKFSKSEFMSLVELNTLCKQVDFIAAHNAEFEMKFTRKWLDLQDDQHHFSEVNSKPWIDTLLHVPYPDSMRARDLVSLCSHHGFFNPHPHRAFWDAWAMMKILDQYADRLDEIVANASAKRTKLLSKGITFQTKDWPKELGYRWDGAIKRWYLVVKESELQNEIEKAKTKGFEVDCEAVPVRSCLADY